MTRSALGALVLIVALASERADACELPAPVLHEVEPAEQEVDENAPGRALITGVTVSRGRGAGLGCGGVTSCDDLGIITVEIAAPSDDRTPDGELGYRLGISAGQLPEGLTLPVDLIKAREGVIDLVWVDGATDAQDTFAFDLSVAAVDLAGNFGPFSAPIRVEHGGQLGCGQGASAGPVGLLFVALLALRRRRQ
jgi:MYXO-CTERM domain-containing protein